MSYYKNWGWLDNGKLVPVAVDLSKLIDVVKMMLLKKQHHCYDKLVAKLDNIDASYFV